MTIFSILLMLAGIAWNGAANSWTGIIMSGLVSLIGMYLFFGTLLRKNKSIVLNIVVSSLYLIATIIVSFLSTIEYLGEKNTTENLGPIGAVYLIVIIGSMIGFGVVGFIFGRKKIAKKKDTTTG